MEELETLEELQKAKKEIVQEMHKVIIGQDEIIEKILISLFAGGHCLLIGVPGLAKTLMIKTLSQILDLSFKRIQFTPDLMPSDITGTEVIQEDSVSHKRSFNFLPGPIFANLVLADEINRAPPKTQSALLEAMQEYQVTTGGEVYTVPLPFLVLATQNPIEQEGTYVLPEAQIDRFMLKMIITYPNKDEELKIINRVCFNTPENINSIITTSELNSISSLITKIFVDERLKEYMVNIVSASRKSEKTDENISEYIRFGASPRATISLSLAARAHAFLQGRLYVTPGDIKTIAPDVLRHRILLTYEAIAENVSSDQIVNQIMNTVVVP